MKIAIDARAASHPQPGGFKTYTENLLRYLPKVMADAEIVCYVDRPYNAEGLKQIRVLPASPLLFGVVYREQWSVPRQACRDNVDLLHFPCSTGARFCQVPTVVTIHDLIGFRQKPKLRGFSGVERLKRLCMWLYHRWAVCWAARQARRIITDSLFSASEITNLLGIPSTRISVIYQAPADHFHRLSAVRANHIVRTRFGINPPYILSLGSADPRKNMQALIQAYARLPASLRRQFPLVIVLTHGALANSLKAMVNDKDIGGGIHFVPRVSDEDLAGLYNAATLFAFPSVAEGFGLPVLEAMACGTPVVASNLTSIPEVAGDAAELADPRDERAFAQALIHVLTSPERQAALAEAGLRRARQFSWQCTAQMTLDVYREVVASHAGN